MGFGYLGYFSGFDHGQPVDGIYALKITQRDINISNHKSIESDIMRFIEEIERDQANRGLVLDFSDVAEIDPAGVGFLVQLAERAQKIGRCYGLASINNEVYKVLKLTKMTEEIFKGLIFKSMGEAYKRLKNFVPGKGGEAQNMDG